MNSSNNTAPRSPVAARGVVRQACEVLWAIVFQRCPACHEGRMFRGLVTMNDPCPVCGLMFQREEGYFLGAMYVSYVLSATLMILFYCLACKMFPSLGGMTVALVAMIPYLPFCPIVFRYSRVLWIYFDRTSDHGDVSMAPFEKMRLQKLNETHGLGQQRAPTGSNGGGKGNGKKERKLP